MSLGKGRGQKRDYNGKLIGQSNDIPDLATTIRLHASYSNPEIINYPNPPNIEEITPNHFFALVITNGRLFFWQNEM